MTIQFVLVSKEQNKTTDSECSNNYYFANSFYSRSYENHFTTVLCQNKPFVTLILIFSPEINTWLVPVTKLKLWFIFRIFVNLLNMGRGSLDFAKSLASE